jgi:hypothetical protein
METIALLLRLTHGIRFAPSGLGLHKPPVGRALGAGTPFEPVPSSRQGRKPRPPFFGAQIFHGAHFKQHLYSLVVIIIKKLPRQIIRNRI